jgi:predicted transcriptional regulator
MDTLLIVALMTCTLLAPIGAEIVLKGRRLQSNVKRVVPLYIVMALCCITIGAYTHYPHPIVILMYWCGYFLTWFGIRSHLESSILLKMLTTLQKSSLSRDELMKAYLQSYSIRSRITELENSGLLESKKDIVSITTSGKKLLSIIDFLD